MGLLHPLARELEWERDAIWSGVGQGLGQLLLCLDRDVEAILDVVFLAHGVGYRLAGLVQRPAEQPDCDRPLAQQRLGGTVFALGMSVEDRQDLATVRHILALLARELLVHFRRQ